MRVAVLGLAHLGGVTAACLASLGHEVVGVDEDTERVQTLAAARAPFAEEGLDELLARGIGMGRLRFSADLAELSGAELVWVTYDTPLAADGLPDSAWVMARVESALRALGDDALLLISSQLPVGSTRRLAEVARQRSPTRRLGLAYSPENLRLGHAVADFLRPARIVVGVMDGRGRARLDPLLRSISASILWMSVESAEMSKHALNAFFATSIAFSNEIASLCEVAGADARQVEAALRSEPRIGARAYLAPGQAFGGGTLARDVAYLTSSAARAGLSLTLLQAVLPSNAAHRDWARRKLSTLLAPKDRPTVAVWGLAYKAGTDSTAQSTAVDLCEWLLGRGARLQVHDPKVRQLPPGWEGVTRFEDALSAVRGAEVLVVATGWPEYAGISAEQLAQCAPDIEVLDPDRILEPKAWAHARLRYFSVGMPAKEPQ